MKELIAIQQELKAPKAHRNTFGNYNYRNCEDILEAAKPLCKKYDVMLTVSDEMVMLGERYYIKATATISNKDNSVSVSAFAREAETKKGMDESQITGTASSYARKYALNGLFLIDDTKDADTDENKKESENKAKAGFNMATEEQIELIIELCNDLSYPVATIEKTFKVDDLSELSHGAAENVIKQLTNKGAKK
jgi:hypothetical protein